MAKKKSNTGEETIVDVQQAYSKTEAYVEDNKKTLTIVAVIMILLFGGYFAYTKLYLAPRSQEGMDLIWKAEYWFEIDSLDKAMYGNESYYGFSYIADEYGSTKAGELANYYLGVINLKQGNYEIAIDHLEDAELEDEIIGAMAKGNLGDAYVEVGNYDKALSHFNDAIAHSDNELTAPMYLLKAGLVLEEKGEFGAALDNYERIKEEFPTSNEARNIDGYIARVGG